MHTGYGEIARRKETTMNIQTCGRITLKQVLERQDEVV
jgi:hypothetical protein